MKVESPEISALVEESLAEVLRERDGEARDIGAGTRLIGRQSVLDSLGLVTLIMEIEDRLLSRHGISVSLADDRAMSQEKSPFLTAASLTDYISRVLDDDDIGPAGSSGHG